MCARCDDGALVLGERAYERRLAEREIVDADDWVGDPRHRWCSRDVELGTGVAHVASICVGVCRRWPVGVRWRDNFAHVVSGVEAHPGVAD